MLNTLPIFLLMFLGVSCGDPESSFTAGNYSVSNSEASKDGVNKNEASKGTDLEAKGKQVATLPDSADNIVNKSPAKPDPEPEYTIVSSEFVSSRIEKASMSLDVSGEYSSQSFTMNYKKTVTEHSKSFSQVSRSQIVNLHEQGYSGKDENETFSVSSMGILDLLVVVDNSGSMKEEQQNLSTKLAPLLSYVKDSDWQIGVMTTDPKDPCLRGLIKKGDANSEQAFSDAVMAGLKGSGNEQGILQAVEGLKCASSNWVRSQSTVAVLIVSDEDNCSNGKGCIGAADEKATYLTDYLSSIRELGKSARVYGLYHIPGQVCKSAYNVAPIYHEAVTLSSGKSGSICDADYTSTLSAVSADIGQILETTFELAYSPDLSALSISLDGVAINSGYTVKGKTIEISNLPQGSKELTVSYTHGATPTYKTFSLMQEPLAGSLKVYVEGVLVNENTYDLDSAAKTVTFKDSPADNAKIKFEYKENLPLIKEFNLGSNVDESSIKALSSGMELSVSAFDQKTGIAIFDPVPEEGADLKVDFRTVVQGAPILSYGSLENAEKSGEIKAIDQSSKEEIPVQIVEGRFQFKVEDFSNGRQIEVSYRNLEGDPSTATLAFEPYQGKVELSLEDEAGDVSTDRCDSSATLIDGKNVKFSCEFMKGDKLKFDYEFLTDQTKSFILREELILEGLDIKVWVNGSVDKTFKVEKNAIVFEDDLPALSTVKIEASVIKQ